MSTHSESTTSVPLAWKQPRKLRKGPPEPATSFTFRLKPYFFRELGSLLILLQMLRFTMDRNQSYIVLGARARHMVSVWFPDRSCWDLFGDSPCGGFWTKTCFCFLSVCVCLCVCMWFRGYPNPRTDFLKDTWTLNLPFKMDHCSPKYGAIPF